MFPLSRSVVLVAKGGALIVDRPMPKVFGTDTETRVERLVFWLTDNEPEHFVSTGWDAISNFYRQKRAIDALDYCTRERIR